MPDAPTVVMVHSVSANPAHDAEEERERFEERLGIEVGMARTPPESRRLIADAEVVICSWLPDDVLDAAGELRWLQAVSSGVDFLPLERLRDDGVVLTNVAGIHAEPIAEQVLGYVLIFSRRIHRGMRQQRESRWQRYEGDELGDKTVGIVGVGSVGGRVAELSKAHGMEVLGMKRDPSTVHDAVDEAFDPDGLYELLPESDYVVLSCPLTEETRGMIGNDAVEAMDNDAVLINVARGGIVDYDRLTTALQRREIRGAALDVFPEEPYDADSTLWSLPNVIATPHMADSTPRKAERVADVFADNYEAYVAGDPDAMPTRVL